MQTPEEKYFHDPTYRQLVDMLENFIHQAQFTPSELREASMFACIRYEMRRFPRGLVTIDPKVESAIQTLSHFTAGKANANSR